jgi:hypothetical protein
MPTYNGAAYVATAIESVLSQTFEDFELIVIDDCSDDETLALVERFQDERIRIERNPRRLGLIGNWNRCLDAATGAYVTVFHQDDVMAPDNLARKVAVLDERSSVAFVHSSLRQIGADGSVLSEWWYAPPAPEDGGVHAGRDFLERLFWGDNLVCCPSVLLRREAVTRHGPFDTQLPFAADWEMWMRLCLFHDVAYIPDPLISYRRHPDAETERFRGAAGLEQSFAAKHRLLMKYGERLPPDWRQRLVDGYQAEAVRQACEELQRGNESMARRLLDVGASLPGYGSSEEGGDLDRSLDLSLLLVRNAILGERLSLRDEELEGWRRQCQSLESEIVALRASRSWKITAPVRAVFRVLTGRPA